MRDGGTYSQLVLSIASFGTKRDMNIKEIVKDNEVRFVRYRQGNAYYSVRVPSERADYMFAVPLSDVGDATLFATDKAIVFMRYIRKAIEERTFVKVNPT